MIIQFTVPGEPRGKGRPRLGRSGHAYTPHTTAVYENLVKVCFKEEFPDQTPLDPAVGVQVNICAYFPIPKSTSKKKRAEITQGFIKCLKKPDCDNIAKIICDALNGIAYHDDSQIYYLTIEKHYNEIPGVLVRMEWDDGEQN